MFMKGIGLQFCFIVSSLCDLTSMVNIDSLENFDNFLMFLFCGKYLNNISISTYFKDYKNSALKPPVPALYI